MSDEEVMDHLRSKVAEAKGSMASAAVLIRGFKDRLQKALDSVAGAPKGNTALAEEIRAIVSDLDSSEDDLAAAVAENPDQPSGGEPQPQQ